MMVWCSITAAHFRCLHTAYSSTIQPYSTETLPSESLLATVEGAKLRLGTCVMRQVSTKKSVWTTLSSSQSLQHIFAHGIHRLNVYIYIYLYTTRTYGIIAL